MKRINMMVKTLFLFCLIFTPIQVMAANSFWAWGDNYYWQLGSSSFGDRTRPVQVRGLNDIVTVTGGGAHSMALIGNGTVWAWGYNGEGQLGIGYISFSEPMPAQVSGLADVTAIGGGWLHSLAVKRDGTVWAWGWNGLGQLGNGTTVNQYTPVQVTGLTDVVSTAAGGVYSLALKSDGTVWAWGSNSNGQLGNGSTTDQYMPVQVAGLTDVVSIAAGVRHSLALKRDGTVWAWGFNGYDQLGNGSTTDQYTPVQVANITGVTAIAAGYLHSLALKNDGTIWAWGLNANGQLGNGSFSNQHAPVQVTGLTDVIAIAGGGSHSLAIRNDATVWAWGLNYDGQLGNGSTSCGYYSCGQPTPMQVTGLPDVGIIAAGAWHSLAIPIVQSISIDIKPGSFPNSINPESRGKIPVAILTTETFDANDVDIATVLFGATGAEVSPVQHALEDVDGDGDTDLILHFNTQDTGIKCGDTAAFLTGKAFNGKAIEGFDHIETSGCK